MFAYWGELAALGTAVCWTFTAVFFAASGKRIGSAMVNRSRLIFALLLLSTSHYFLQGSLFPWHAEPFRWFWLTISSVLGLVIGDSMLFYAFVLIGPRLGTLLMSTVPIISALFGWLLFGELLVPLEWLAVLLSVSGVAWVVTERQPGLSVNESRDYKRGLLFALGGAVGQVANLVTARYGLVGGFPTLSATLIRIFVAVIILWGMAVAQGKVQATVQSWRQREVLLPLLGGSIAGPFLGIWLSLIAITMTRLGIASTLMALPPVLLIPVEYVLTKKRVSNRGIAGTMVALLGVALLFLPG